MKVQRQIKIDRYLGYPAGILLNLLVRLTGKILRINHRLDRPFHRIAIVKYKGLGSMVQATPMIRELKKNYPESRIVFITSTQNKALVQLLPEVDGGIYLNDRSFMSTLLSLPGFIGKLWRNRFQLLFDLELYSNISSILSTLSCATNRFGFYLRSGHYRMGLYTHMMYFNTRSPLSETYLQMVRCLGIRTDQSRLLPLKNPAPDASQHLKKPYFVINVNASDLRVERRWPQASFAQLSDRLEELYPRHQQYFIGSPAEKEYVTQTLSLKKANGENCHSLAGQTSLSELIGILEESALMVSCDTGPAHLAYAQQCKAVVLFGPVAPQQFYIPDNVGIVFKNVYCSPCIHEFDTPPCRGDNQCMKQISVEEVLKKIEEVLEKDFVRKGRDEKLIYEGDRNQALGKVGR